MYNALVVDDEPAAHLVINKFGEWDRYQIRKVLYSPDGQDAIATMNIYHPIIVFVDIRMPVMSGIDFLKNVSGQFSQTAFIIVSGYDDFQYAKDAMHYGAIDYLLKPIVPQELNAAIRKAMGLLFPDKDFDDIHMGPQKTAKETVAAIRYSLDHNYMDPFSLQNFAEGSFFSKEYLSRLFKDEYGKTISEYLLDVRMHHAKALLNNASVSVSDVAAMVGYPDSKYFARVFKTKTGWSPAQFRNAVINDAPVQVRKETRES